MIKQISRTGVIQGKRGRGEEGGAQWWTYFVRVLLTGLDSVSSLCGFTCFLNGSYAVRLCDEPCERDNYYILSLVIGQLVKKRYFSLKMIEEDKFKI